MSYSSPPSPPEKMVGYTRHNPFEKNPDPQLKGIHLSRFAGSNVSVDRLKHTIFPYVIKSLREGETLVVQSMDRIAGNMKYLRQVIRTVTSKGGEGEVFEGRSDLYGRRVAYGHSTALRHRCYGRV